MIFAMLRVIIVAILLTISAHSHPPAIIQEKVCDLQKSDIFDKTFNAKENLTYGTLYLYDFATDNPGYEACYVNVYESSSPWYDCSTIGVFNCFDTANHFLSSYTSIPSKTNGTTCYAMSQYQDLQTAVLQLGLKDCLKIEMATVKDNPCARLNKMYDFSFVYC